MGRVDQRLRRVGVDAGDRRGELGRQMPTPGASGVPVVPRLTEATVTMAAPSKPCEVAIRPSALLKHEAQPAAKRVSGLALGFDTLPGLPSSRSTTPSSLRTRPPRPPWALAAVV